MVAIHISGSVSYTHLDVYKRQSVNHPSIEKYKSPVGDGNKISYRPGSHNVIEKYKSPVGDGNSDVKGRGLTPGLLRNISPR